MTAILTALALTSLLHAPSKSPYGSSSVEAKIGMAPADREVVITDFSGSSGALSRRLEVTIQVDNLHQGLAAAERWVARMGLNVLEAKNNREEAWQRKASMTFSVPDSLFGSLKDSLSKLGKPVEYNLDLVSKADEIEKISHELRFRQSERDVYAKELQGVDRARESQAYNTLWSKAREIDSQIFRLEENLIEARQRVRGNRVSLTLEEPSEPPTSSGKSWVEFTNMPGAEFTFVSMENPQRGISAATYMGGSVRYLFTKGKSYLVLGVLKSQDDLQGDTAVFKDLFLYGYGTDFYPSHFGRGQRSYLNLYSGFTVGGMFLSSMKGNRHLAQVTPHVGLELYKGKQLLLDVRGGYLLPLDSDLNLHLRGWTVSPSLNFVF